MHKTFPKMSNVLTMLNVTCGTFYQPVVVLAKRRIRLVLRS